VSGVCWRRATPGLIAAPIEKLCAKVFILNPLILGTKFSVVPVSRLDFAESRFFSTSTV
jgi:hypothetical protein